MIIAIFDFDGTLTRSSWRRKAKNRDTLNTFDLLIRYDKPNEYAIEMLRAHEKNDDLIVISSGKQESKRAVISEWLYKNNILPDRIYMRNQADTGKSHLVKKKNLNEIKEEFPGAKIVCYEDWETHIEMYISEGCVVTKVENK